MCTAEDDANRSTTARFPIDLTVDPTLSPTSDVMTGTDQPARASGFAPGRFAGVRRGAGELVSAGAGTAHAAPVARTPRTVLPMHGGIEVLPRYGAGTTVLHQLFGGGPQRAVPVATTAPAPPGPAASRWALVIAAVLLALAALGCALFAGRRPRVGA